MELEHSPMVLPPETLRAHAHWCGTKMGPRPSQASQLMVFM